MDKVERVWAEMMVDIEEARRRFDWLASGVTDAVGVVIARAEFDSLEAKMREFARCQLGIRRLAGRR